MPIKGTPEYERWKTSFEIKRAATKAARLSLSIKDSGDFSIKQMESLFNFLYETVQKGARILRDKSNLWFLLLPDSEVEILDTHVMQYLHKSLSEESKRFLLISSSDDFFASSYESLIKQSLFNGVQFYDLNPVLRNPTAFFRLISDLYNSIEDKDISKVVGMESRGFFYAAPLALKLKAGFVPIRKKNKLPGDLFSVSYDKEYGTDEMFIQQDAILQDDSVLFVDDVLATGGTAKAAQELLYAQADKVQSLFVLELTDLRGGDKLQEYISLIKI